jgi:integration host factor subunit beta
MTRSELIDALAQRFPRLIKTDADIAVTEILGAIARTLIEGRRVEIRGFGTFALNYRPPRVGRNPKTGERVDVPAKYTPHFKPGKELRERVDGYR